MKKHDEKGSFLAVLSLNSLCKIVCRYIHMKWITLMRVEISLFLQGFFTYIDVLQDQCQILVLALLLVTCNHGQFILTKFEINSLLHTYARGDWCLWVFAFVLHEMKYISISYKDFWILSTYVRSATSTFHFAWLQSPFELVAALSDLLTYVRICMYIHG